MAYLSRCHMLKNMKNLSKILTGSGSRTMVAEKNLTVVVRNYNLLITEAKKSTQALVPIKNICQKSNKLSGSLSVFANQIRASSTGDHVRLWQMERVVSAAFIVLLPGTILLQNPIIDIVFSTLLVMHAHWGIEAIILDYARPAVVGNLLPKIAFLALYILSGVTLAGLLTLVYNGPGVGGSVQKLWAIGNKQ